MKSINPRLIMIILGIVLILILIAIRLLGSSSSTGNILNPSMSNNGPTPTTVPFSSGDDSPFLMAQNMPVTEAGVDLQDVTVQTSQIEVQRIIPALPYETSLVTEAGIPIDITISRIIAQEHPWYLSVDIYGVDYEVAADSPDYQIMKNAFLEGVNASLEWLDDNNIDTTQTYIEWGSDKAIIQNRVQQWLSE